MDATVLLNRILAKGKLRHLQAVVRLDELRNMTRAAESMGVTQSALSQLLADLERLLETRLFLRHARGVEPTGVANSLIAVAKRVLYAVEDGAEALSAGLYGARHFVHVSATTSTIENLVAPTLGRFLIDQPDIHVTVDEHTGQALDASFIGEVYDMVCCLRRDVLPEGWAFEPMLQDRLVAVCSSRARLAKGGTVTPEALGRALWIPNHARTASRRGFEYLARRYGWSDVNTLNLATRSLPLTYDLLQRQEAVTVLPRSLLTPWLRAGTVVALPIEIDIPHWELGVHWRPERATPATQMLIRALRASIPAAKSL
ncbi:LysR family transcriptional regulator [Cereibacter sphaeroides]|nr:LysR family transcriptional regulator [Cereibacter sphaeroides]